MCRNDQDQTCSVHTITVDINIIPISNNDSSCSDDIIEVDDHVNILLPAPNPGSSSSNPSCNAFDVNTATLMNKTICPPVKHEVLKQKEKQPNDSKKRRSSCIKSYPKNGVGLYQRKRVRFTKASAVSSLISKGRSPSPLSLPSILSLHSCCKTDAKASSSPQTDLRLEQSQSIPCSDEDDVKAIIHDELIDCLPDVSVQVIEYLPLSSELTVEEKMTRWIQPSDHRQSRKNAGIDARNFQLQNDTNLCLNNAEASSPLSSSLPSMSCSKFAEHYTTMYRLCQNSTSPLLYGKLNEKKGETASICNEHVEARLSAVALSTLVNAIDFSRGLEGRIIPHLALERKLIRLVSVREICLIYKLLLKSKEELSQWNPTYNTVDEVIALMAKSMSLPARKFGESNGAIDALAAMLDYTQWISHNYTMENSNTHNS